MAGVKGKVILRAGMEVKVRAGESSVRLRETVKAAARGGSVFETTATPQLREAHS